MHFLDTLNPEQRDAVLHVSGPLLILAGAGSGKTRVITSRIAYLVGDGHARPNEVLAVTFTNKAAEEMRTRVEALLGEDCSRMWVSTFHSLCARLLRREAPAIGLSRDFVIYDSSDQLTVVKQALKDLQIDDSYVPHGPEFWTFPPGRSDQWGITNPQTPRLARIQELFRFSEDGFRT